MWPVAPLSGSVLAVSRSPLHGFSKQTCITIHITAGHGVDGDAHAGASVQHLYRKRKNPLAPNLCQVHLLQAELLTELALAPGELGENVAVAGVDLLALPVGSLIYLGASAVVEVTGLRDPCSQMNGLRPGLMKQCLARDAEGAKVRRAGIMGIAAASGEVRAGDPVRVVLPADPWRRMGPV